ncbi:MAG: aquaporin [Acidimicrobiales bacterium]|jgi:glycerol uptake facilitator-like aquaporin|tara:strand:- start:287 stop:955 length:669 start_codon:yes stop_codon:yes gene_type:complete
MTSKTRQGFTSELIGTFFLLLAVVGSGIMAQNLSPNDTGLQLLENSFATAGALICLILVFGSTSGAHFNPIVTFWARTEKQIDTRTAGFFMLAQLIGAISGAMAANLIFELDAVNWSTKDRTGWEIWLSEVIATFGLLMVIIGVIRSRKEQWVALAVAAYIAGAYFFTSSTSFANPAVTVARTFSDTFAGISPASAPMFILSQLIGCALALTAMNITHPRSQ